MNLGVTEIAKRKLADAIVDAGLAKLTAQDCHNRCGRTGHALPHLNQPLEGGWPLMRIEPPMLAVEKGEAVMPARIGAPRHRMRSRISIRNHHEPAEPHQRQRLAAPGFRPG